jgi:hypothetical protein
VKFRFAYTQRILLAAALAIGVAACDEKLDTGLACPALCPHGQTALRDTTLYPVLLDTSVSGFPSLGSEFTYFIASLGDTLETAAIVRFDSLPTMFRRSNETEDSLIYAVDSASIKLFIIKGDTIGPPTTIELYDVDLGGADDTDPLAVRTAFTPDRLLGSITVPADSMRDTVVVPIDNAKLLAKIIATQDSAPGARLRVGVKVNPAGGGATHFTMQSSENPGANAFLRFRPHTDISVAKLTDISPLSRTPENLFVRSVMRDYFVVLDGPADPPATVLRVGGLPGRRVYFRLDLPTGLLDSSNIVRATLVLTQRPNPDAPQAGDTVTVREFRIVAGPDVTDLARALTFVQRFRNLDTLATVATDSGRKEFELIDLVRAWRGTKPEKTPRVVALAAVSEGQLPRLVDFFSTEADASVRPYVRITFLPRPEGGLP